MFVIISKICCRESWAFDVFIDKTYIWTLIVNLYCIWDTSDSAYLSQRYKQKCSRVETCIVNATIAHCVALHVASNQVDIYYEIVC